MRVLNPSLNIDCFFERVASAPSKVLFLDYDGTLAPFTDDRSQTSPFPGTELALRRLLENPAARIVFVSGRPAKDLASYFRLPRLPDIWGSHGFERVTPDGRYEITKIASSTRAALAAEATRLRALGWERQTEPKPFGLALHGRGLEAGVFSAVRNETAERWRELEYLDLMVQDFDGGIELRASARDKGFAVATVLAEIDACAARGAGAMSGEGAKSAERSAAQVLAMGLPGTESGSRISKRSATGQGLMIDGRLRKTPRNGRESKAGASVRVSPIWLEHAFDNDTAWSERGVAAAYLGDDWADECAFRALKGRGLGVLVRDDHRETEADLWISPPEELLGFLDRWGGSVGAGRGSFDGLESMRGGRP